MQTCVTCGEETSNPKFCSRSCAATAGNAVRPRHRNNALCIGCGKSMRGKGSAAKYCLEDCETQSKRQSKIDTWLAGSPVLNTSLVQGSVLRAYLLEDQSNTCALCPQGLLWQGKELRFILDHIDGNSEDNSRSNVRLVCPNCDSQLDTYKAKNRGKGRYARRVRYAEGKSF